MKMILMILLAIWISNTFGRRGSAFLWKLLGFAAAVYVLRFVFSAAFTLIPLIIVGLVLVNVVIPFARGFFGSFQRQT